MNAGPSPSAATVAGPRRFHPWTCAAINLLAFPGLGTVMAGRRWGYVQATIMVVGFVLVMVFFGVGYAAALQLATDIHWSEQSFYARLRAWGWAGGSGLLLCAVAWGWALASSIAIVRDARKTPPVLPPKPV
jgi:hypothetical protein